MASNFPTSLDTFTNPTSADALDSVSVPHATQHSDLNDAVEALEAKVGVNSSAVASSLDYKVAQRKILQVVYGSTTTRVDSSSTSYVDTGLSVSITPTSTSSNVLVLVAQNGCFKWNNNSNNGLNLKLLRDATDIDEFAYRLGYDNVASYATPGSGSLCVLDSPATTSATTYKTQFANNTASAQVTVQLNNMLSTIIAMEVSA